MVHAEFTEQLVRGDERWYETEFLWCGSHPELPNNQRLEGLTRRLQFSEYNEIIQNKLKVNIAKQQLDSREEGSKILGLKCDKVCCSDPSGLAKLTRPFISSSKCY